MGQRPDPEPPAQASRWWAKQGKSRRWAKQGKTHFEPTCPKSLSPERGREGGGGEGERERARAR